MPRKRKLPKGEETLPITEIEGRFIMLADLTFPLQLGIISNELLIERVRKRTSQNREATIYRIEYELTPADQLEHMILGDAIGLELMEAERKLLEEELKILRGDYGDS